MSSLSIESARPKTHKPATEIVPSTSRVQTARPSTRRTQRAKVLDKPAIIRPSIGEDPVELTPLPSQAKVAESVAEWEQADSLQYPESDNETAEILKSEAQSIGRPSFIHLTQRRTGVHMDLATKLANESFIKAKDALEAAGTMKKESKQIALSALQDLYEAVLSLSDSRSRHRLNLEKERSRHSQELVRIERAHNKQMAETVKNLSSEVVKARNDITGTLEEAKAIRSWLGYETQQPYKQIGEIGKEVQVLEKLIRELGHSSSRVISEGVGDKHLEPLKLGHVKLQTDIDRVSNQLDALRRELDRLNASTKKILDSNSKLLDIQSRPIPETTNLPTKISLDKLLAKIDAMPIPSLEQNQPPAHQEDLKQHLVPLTERLEVVSSELRTLRSMREERTPPPTISLGAEIAIAESNKAKKPTYAQAVQKTPPPPRPNHTLIVSSTDPQKTGENVIETIRVALDSKKTGAKVERVRKARHQKVVLSCSTKEDLALVRSRVQANRQLKVEVARTNNPLAKVRDVLSFHSDAEIIDLIKAQNKNLLENIGAQDSIMKVRYRKKARNQHECHVVLELAPEIHKRFMEAGKIYIGLQRRPIVDQSPLVQCIRCLGYGHTRGLCRANVDLCSHCGENHSWEKCSHRLSNKPPACINCSRAKNSEAAHNAFDSECPERQKWDAIARSKITYC